MKRDSPPIEDQWKNFDHDVPKISLTASSQVSFYRFTHDFFGGMTSVSFCTQPLDEEKS